MPSNPVPYDEVRRARRAGMRRAPRPGEARDRNELDFRISRADANTWKVQALSQRGRTFLARDMALEGRRDHFFVGHTEANDLLLHFRDRGYETEYIGMHGPVRL